MDKSTPICVNNKKCKLGALQVSFLALKLEIVPFSPAVPFSKKDSRYSVLKPHLIVGMC